MKLYQSELMRCENKATGGVTYFVKKCDVFSRISRDEYETRFRKSDGVSCLFTRSTKRHTRHYMTIIMEG